MARAEAISASSLEVNICLSLVMMFRLFTSLPPAGWSLSGASPPPQVAAR